MEVGVAVVAVTVVVGAVGVMGVVIMEVELAIVLVGVVVGVGVDIITAAVIGYPLIIWAHSHPALVLIPSWKSKPCLQMC